jgi:hypothetical protein
VSDHEIERLNARIAELEAECEEQKRVALELGEALDDTTKYLHELRPNWPSSSSGLRARAALAKLEALE